MTINGKDPLITALENLSNIETPPNLINRIQAHWTLVPGPVRDLHVAFTDRGVTYIRPAGNEDEFTESFRQRFEMPLKHTKNAPTGLTAAIQLRTTGRTIPVDLRNLSDFEQAVLTATRQIPRGQTRPYSWIAQEINRPKAVRAVGTALGNNPVPVLIPCHRVVRADGTIGEYIFGTPLKEELLRTEQVNIDEVLELARTKTFYIGSNTTNIVCFPTCPHARRITTPHRHGFRTMAAATKAGYRPCQHCRPTPTQDNKNLA